MSYSYRAPRRNPAMSQTLTLELSDQVYETIRRQAEAAAMSLFRLFGLVAPTNLAIR
jgi:hypothetical protein